MNAWFARVAGVVSTWAGSSWAFVLAFSVIVVWGITGPIFGFSDTWQLVINTGTTIVTFLMVFLIQNTQNRDQRALHLKLDELLRAVEGARQSRFAELEDLPEEELERVRKKLLREIHETVDEASGAAETGRSRLRAAQGGRRAR